MSYDLTHVTKYLFKDKEEYKKLSNEDKEKYFFIENRNLARAFPRQAQFLNNKIMDKSSCMDVWFNFFIKKRTINIPDWYRYKTQTNKKEKSILKSEEVEYLIDVYDLSTFDIEYLERNHLDELKDEIKKYKKFNK